MMRATLESTTDAILVTDGSGKVTDFNAKFVEMWRLPAAAMDPRDHRHVLGIVSRLFAAPEQFVERVETIYATQPPETHDVLETLDGRTIERSTRMQIVDGRNVGRVWSFREVTERKRAEQALRDETRMLEILHQTGKTIASELDLQTVVQAVTDAATQLSKAQFGAFFYNVDEPTGRVVRAVHAFRRAARGIRKIRPAPQHARVRPDVSRHGPRPLGRHHEGTLLRPDVASPRHAERSPARPQLFGGAGHLAVGRSHRRIVLRAPRYRRVHRANGAAGRGNRGDRPRSRSTTRGSTTT